VRCRERFATAQQLLQGFVHSGFALVGRQVQDLHVLPAGTLRLLLLQGIVGHAEAAAGKQVGLVAVLRKGAGLAH